MTSEEQRAYRPRSRHINRGALNLNRPSIKLPGDAFPDQPDVQGSLRRRWPRGAPEQAVRRQATRCRSTSACRTTSRTTSEVTDLRRDIYGTPIPNPTGQTKDYGVLLSTKDSKYSFPRREVRDRQPRGREQRNWITAASTGRSRRPGWRNIKTYYIVGYAWNTASQTNLNHYTPGQRYLRTALTSTTPPAARSASGQSTTGPASSHLETQQQADVRRDAI